MEQIKRKGVPPSEDKEALRYADDLLLADMQVPKNERVWFTTVPKEMTGRDFVLYLGCHILRTSHLIEIAIKILERLGIDFVAIGGPQNCCGIGDYGRGDRWQSDRTVNRLSALARKKVLMWCPSCNFHIGRIAQDDNAPVGFGIEHITKFISENINKVQFKEEIRARVALHKHTTSEQQDLDGEYAENILKAIPGIELVNLNALAELGRHCSQNSIEKLTEEKYMELIRDMFAQAQRNNVEILATIYHSCHREICGEEAHSALKVENYITLLARAMGMEIEDKYKKWKLMKDPQKIMDDAKDCIVSNNLSLEKVRATLSRNF